MAIQYSERTIDDFKGKLVGGGARSNLFEVELPLIAGAAPAGSTRNRNTPNVGATQQGTSSKETDVEELMRFMIKATALPASTVSAISVPFRGRQLHVAGDRSFDDWSVTVINDTNFSIRSAMERWMNLINRHEDTTGLINPASYQKNATVHQLGRGQFKANQVPILRSYKFYGIWPTSIDAISLDYGADNQIQEFNVTFKVHWWEASGNGGDIE
jgi:hypothetical protein